MAGFGRHDWSPPGHYFDLSIVARNDEAGRIAHSLFDLLSGKGLRIHIRIQPAGLPPADWPTKARPARFLLAMPTADHFALMSMERFRAGSPESAPGVTKSDRQPFLMGPIPDDLESLASRIQERIRAGP